jgi:hypothetical protein
MKKFLLSAFGVAMLILLLTIVAYAHPGRTDSSGGHYNNSTGDYHYHHGYSAHDHYDMDGDGVLDCPYDFDDKTNHNNNNSGNPSTSEDTIKKEKNKITFWDVVKAILLMIPLSLATLYILFIILGLICILIECFIEKYLKISIEESKMKRILHISMIVGMVILLPLEFVCILGIL